MLPQDVLLEVTTQPFDMTISSSIIDDGEISPNSSIVNQTCFICNTTTSETFVNLYDTMSEHSNTPIFDFIWKFLDDKPSVRDDTVDGANSNWNSICNRCLIRINEYDLACVTSTNLEEELRYELSQTEAIYTEQENREEPCESDERMPFEPIVSVDETVNWDSSPPVVVSTTDQKDDDEATEREQCIIELSDDEQNDEEAETIELSDDEMK